MSLFDKFKDAVGEKVDEAGSAIEEKATELKNDAEAWAKEKERMLKEFEQEQRALIAARLQSKLDSIFEYAMQTFAEHLKEKVDDPYMPRWVKSLFDDLIDALWPDVKDEFKDVILSGVCPAPGIAHGDPACCGCGWSPLAWFRYTVQPYDRNIWRKIRDPFWWFFNLIYIFPKFGVSQFAYGATFLFIDKDDEFQLQQFILMFKSLQFLSLGILSAMIGSIQYYVCTSMDNCPEYAPQESIWTVSLFVIQIFLVWIAFLLLRCSKKKGGQFYQLQATAAEEKKKAGGAEALNEIAISDTVAHHEHQVANETTKTRARSRLMKFLIYDFIIFLLCAGLCAFMALKNYTDEEAQLNKNDDVNGEQGGNWKFKSGLYWLKAFYGLMSFPFVILLVPGLSTLLSHARPTGYNRWGNCVPYLGVEEEFPTPWRDYRIDPKTGKKVEEPNPNEPTMAERAENLFK